jgi:hypothetical protein
MDLWKLTVMSMITIVIGWMVFTIYASIEMIRPMSPKRLKQEIASEMAKARSEKAQVH